MEVAMNVNMPEAVKIFMETMNTAETEKLDSCLASKAVLFDPADNNDIRGINAIKAFVADSKEKFDLCTTVLDATTTAEGTKVMPTQRNKAPVVTPWLIICSSAPSSPRWFRAKMPSVTKPICPTLE